MKWLARLLKAANYVAFHCVLPYEATVANDVVLAHHGLGVVIHPNVVIGARVLIYHNVTLAVSSWIGSPHVIDIGDDVVIGAGATVISRENQSLHVGKGARIGAGAVVTRDVPAQATAVGVPAKSRVSAP